MVFAEYLCSQACFSFFLFKDRLYFIHRTKKKERKKEKGYCLCPLRSVVGIRRLHAWPSANLPGFERRVEKPRLVFLYRSAVSHCIVGFLSSAYCAVFFLTSEQKLRERKGPAINLLGHSTRRQNTQLLLAVLSSLYLFTAMFDSAECVLKTLCPVQLVVGG